MNDARKIPGRTYVSFQFVMYYLVYHYSTSTTERVWALLFESLLRAQGCDDFYSNELHNAPGGHIRRVLYHFFFNSNVFTFFADVPVLTAAFSAIAGPYITAEFAFDYDQLYMGMYMHTHV